MAKSLTSFSAAAMAPNDPEFVRNVVLLGHTQSGKTQLSEALLALAGRIPPQGIVDPNSVRERVMDSAEDEQARGISFSTGVASVPWKADNGDWFKINLLDTPGMGELFSDSYGAIASASGVMVCVSAVDGVKTVTRRAVKLANETGMGKLIAVTKLDKENTDFLAVCDRLPATFGRGTVPVNLPIGQAAGLKGIVNLIEMKAYMYADDGSGAHKIAEIPADLVDQAQEFRTRLEELAAESDEELLDLYCETGELTKEQFTRGINAGVRDGTIIPVLATSATHNIGLRQLLDRLLAFLVPPTGRPSPALDKEGAEVQLAVDPDAPATAFVFKTAVDAYAGAISYMKLVTGRLRTGDELTVHGRGIERLAHLYTPMGAKLDEVEEVVAGDIFCAVKLKDTKTGDTLRAKDGQYSMVPVNYPEPALALALTPASRAHEDKLSGALEKLCVEDPRLAIDRDQETHEMVLKGAGQMHLELAIGRLKSRYGVEVISHSPTIPYRETIRTGIEQHARHKKQTGGHGQFADIWVRFEPQERDAGFEFADSIVGGVVPRNFIPAVEKGMNDAASKGMLAGYPAVDFKVTLYDGSYHPVDSSDMAFQIASRLAFREAWARCKPVLLEPIMAMEVSVPEDCVGDVMGDLNRRRGKVRGMNADGGESIIETEVPLGEVQTYATTLKSLTGDRGTFTMNFIGYAEVPSNIQAQLVDARAKEKERD